MGIEMTLKRLKSELTAWGRQLTWPWLAAFALLAACIGFYLSVVMPTRHLIGDLKTQFSTLQQDKEHLKETSQGVARSAPAGQLESFYQGFPAENTVPDALEKMIKLAQTKGINPKQAEYRIIRNNPGELLSYQITLPIKGPYPKIMAFVFEVLANVPNLSLDNVSFQRQKIGDNVIEATLKMTLYIKRGGVTS